jgi:hypothetical protein
MKRLVIACALVLMSPVGFAHILDMTLDSTNDASISSETGYVTDDILLVEVAEKDNSPSGWVWPVMEFTFGPVDLTNAEELQLDARYHQEEYTWDWSVPPDGIDETRTPWGDCHLWLVLHDSDGTSWDLGWDPTMWSMDEWRTCTRDLTTLPGGDFDGTQVTKLTVITTNWHAPDPNNDFIRCSRLVITEVPVPEPGTMALFGAGLLSLLALRRKK